MRTIPIRFFLILVLVVYHQFIHAQDVLVSDLAQVADGDCGAGGERKYLVNNGTRSVKAVVQVRGSDESERNISSTVNPNSRWYIGCSKVGNRAYNYEILISESSYLD